MQKFVGCSNNNKAENETNQEDDLERAKFQKRCTEEAAAYWLLDCKIPGKRLDCIEHSIPARFLKKAENRFEITTYTHT